MGYEYKKIKVPRFNEASGFYTTKRRSKQMGRIKSKNTKPELLFRKALWRKNVRYRVHTKSLPGKPDVSIKKYRLAIFIDGEFWHGHNWEERKLNIKSNRAFWIPKIERNIQRDLEVNDKLQAMGYTIFRFWEHEIKQDLKTCINDVMVYLQTGSFN
ncbi:DNA mismatch endonuclease Vsr [Winogradskyella sp. 3972H.M.0a.05]|uniref:very short patch repair endonuclease n=1 Tax=Winogradskyella sp. 3972H.M.0a.05 TaxID=2950277 RepID=UPI0033986974